MFEEETIFINVSVILNSMPDTSDSCLKKGTPIQHGIQVRRVHGCVKGEG